MINVINDFPILKSGIVYLDSAASSLTPEQVLLKEMEYYHQYRSNINRSVHSFSSIATTFFENTKKYIAKFLNAQDDEIVLTYGTTFGINLLFYSFFLDYVKEGDEIITTELEHHASIIPMQQLAKRKSAILKFIPLLEDATIDYDNLESAFSKKSKILSITGMSNVTGYCPDLKKIIKIAHSYGCLVLVDGAQLVPHKKVDIKDLDLDFLAFSGHKMLAPTGVGALFIKKSIQENMKPFLYGGDMIKIVKKDDSEFANDGSKFIGGTPNIAGVIGFGEAINYLQNIGMDNIEHYNVGLSNYAFLKASELDYLNVYSQKDSGLFTFNMKNIHSHDVVSLLDSQNIMLRSGYMCAMPLLDFLKIKNCIRASFYIYNTKDDVDKLFFALKKTHDFFSK